MRPQRSRTSLSGITVLELAIACAIILAVGAILAPAVSASVTEARERQCLSNLQELRTATSLYLQDYNEVLPIAWQTIPQGEGKDTLFLSWRHALYSYLKTSGQGKIAAATVDTFGGFHCPSDTYGPAWVSYAVNALITGAGSPEDLEASDALSAIALPERVIWLGETNKNWTRSLGYHDTISDWVRPSMDIGLPKTDDRAVAFYRRWLKERDWTDLAASPVDCPDGMYRCKYPSFHHRRIGERTGFANFLMLDGHVRAFAWGQPNIENFFPNPTPRQLALYNR
jgi:prepilin-type processing-associated H-X9-DG protein